MNNITTITAERTIQFTKVGEIRGVDKRRPSIPRIDKVILDSPPRGKITVAAKYVNKEFMTDAKREINFLLQANQHENIIKLIDYVSNDEEIVIFTELCETSCQEYCEKNPADNLVNISKQLLEAKKHLQKIGISHSAIVARHVLVTTKENDEARVKLIDFMHYIDDNDPSEQNPFDHDSVFPSKCSNFEEIGCLVLQCVLPESNLSNEELLEEYPISRFYPILRDYGMLDYKAAMLATLVHSLISITKRKKYAACFLKHICFYSGKKLKEFIVDVGNFIHEDVTAAGKRYQQNPAGPITTKLAVVTKMEFRSDKVLQCKNKKNETFISKMMQCSAAKYHGILKLSDIILLIRNITQHFDDIHKKCKDKKIQNMMVDPKIDPDKFFEPYTCCYPLLFVWLWHCVWPYSEMCKTYAKFHEDFPCNYYASKDEMFENLENIIFH